MAGDMPDARSRWVLGTSLLKEFLNDDLAIARALRENRWDALAAAADIAWVDVDKGLALTDPALYRSLREAITLFFIKGCGAMDRQALYVKAGWSDASDGLLDQIAISAAEIVAAWRDASAIEWRRA